MGGTGCLAYPIALNQLNFYPLLSLYLDADDYMLNFLNAFTQAIEVAIGEDWTTYTNAQILQKTGMSISEETLRKIRVEGHIPNARTRDRIFKELQSTPTESGMLYTNSNTAREEVRALLGLGLTEIPLRARDPRLECDLVLEDKGLGIPCHILRCLDDAEGEPIVQMRYFSDAIVNLADTMKSFSAYHGVIISHRKPPPESVDQANRARIALRDYESFVTSRLKCEKLKSDLDEACASRGLTKESFTSLPALKVIDTNRNENVDSLQTLIEHLSTTPGAAVATVLGSFGTGKTSTITVNLFCPYHVPTATVGQAFLVMFR